MSRGGGSWSGGRTATPVRYPGSGMPTGRITGLKAFSRRGVSVKMTAVLRGTARYWTRVPRAAIVCRAGSHPTAGGQESEDHGTADRRIVSYWPARWATDRTIPMLTVVMAMATPRARLYITETRHRQRG